MCKYCSMVNRNKGVASSIREAVEGKTKGFKIEYPFISIQIIDNSGKGISSKGLNATHCPMCGNEIEKVFELHDDCKKCEDGKCNLFNCGSYSRKRQGGKINGKML